MLINILLALISLLSTNNEEKRYVCLHYFQEPEILYDFEYCGLYYEFAGDNEVNLVRKKSLCVSTDMECSYDEILESAYNEWNMCYTGDIVVPDSVEYQGKKYRVASVNQHAFSFSKGLKSVIFTSNVKMDDEDNTYKSGGFGHFHMCKDLEKVVYHDSLTTFNRQLGYCPNLKELHLPPKLTSVINSFAGTGLPVIDLANQSSYVPSRFYVDECFFRAYELQKVKFPECDTLHLYTLGMPWANKFQHMVIRPCKTILFDRYELPYYPSLYVPTPLMVISQAIIPPEVKLIDQCEGEYRGIAVLYVPDESMEAYRDAYFWCDFGEIRPMSEYLREENAAIDSPIVSEAAESKLSLSSDREELHIAVSAPAEVTVWSLQGHALWQGTVMDEVVVSLPKGIYIVTTPTSSRKYRH